MCSGAHSVLTFTLADVRLWPEDAKWYCSSNATGRVGVSQKGLRYQATLNLTNLGCYVDPEEAAKRVDEEVRKNHRHGSMLNFPTKAEKQLLQQELKQKTTVFQQRYLLRQQNNALKRLKQVKEALLKRLKQVERLELKQEKEASLKQLKQVNILKPRNHQAGCSN